MAAVDEPEAYKAQVSDMDEPQTFRAHWRFMCHTRHYSDLTLDVLLVQCNVPTQQASEILI